jgi:hypothetical protein
MERQRRMELDEIAVRLLGVIAVRGMPQTQQIAILSRVGFTPKAIADLVGTTANTVRVALVGIRRDEREGRRVSLRRQEQDDEQS